MTTALTFGADGAGVWDATRAVPLQWLQEVRLADMLSVGITPSPVPTAALCNARHFTLADCLGWIPARAESRGPSVTTTTVQRAQEWLLDT